MECGLCFKPIQCNGVFYRTDWILSDSPDNLWFEVSSKFVMCTGNYLYGQAHIMHTFLCRKCT